MAISRIRNVYNGALFKNRIFTPNQNWDTSTLKMEVVLGICSSTTSSIGVQKVDIREVKSILEGSSQAGSPLENQNMIILKKLLGFILKARWRCTVIPWLARFLIARICTARICEPA